MNRLRMNVGRRTFDLGPVDLAFGVLLLLFLEYGVLFILRTSFVIDGVRWFSLFDDGMISMRYARNLVEGAGLVWNPGGEHVEGYTNFFWVLVMSVLHLLPVPQPAISLSVQIVSLLLLAANLWYVRRLSLAVASGSSAVALGAVGLTAFYFSLNNWSLQGMEVGLLALLVTSCAARLSSEGSAGRMPGGVLVAMAIGVLTRADVIPLFLTLWVIHLRKPRRAEARIDWTPLLVITGVAVFHTLFRLWYYGDPLPNTYYLKLEGVPLAARLGRGLSSYADFIADGGVLLFLLPLSLAVTAPGGRRALVLLLVPVLVQSAYSIAVGGDAWEGYGGANRYIAPVMPLMFVLVAWSITSLLERLDIRDRVLILGRERRLKPVLNGALVLYAFWSFNQVHWTSLTLQIPPLEVHNNETMVRSAIAIKETTTPGATVAVVWAGAIPYFSSRPSIDLLGKNDRRIARLPVKHPERFIPGHDKWDYEISLLSDPPDVIAQLWYEVDAVRPFLDGEYDRVKFPSIDTMLYRKATPHIMYDRLPATN